MTDKQEHLYWREWASVRRACAARKLDEPDRHELHTRALGADKSHKHFTNCDFDQVLAEFRSWSRPDNLDAQVRQVDQPRARSLRRVGELMACLEMYHPDPVGYVREIIRDKFNRGSVQQVSEITDLSDKPRHYRRTGSKDLIEGPSQLRQLIMTVEGRLNGKDGFRAGAGDSVHAMLMKARLPCKCATCRPGRTKDHALA